MRRLQRMCALVVLVAVSPVGPPCQAAFHLWDIAEVYSNHDGSVQFIEFFTGNANQQVVGSKTVVATSTVGGIDTVKTFTFPSNLSLVAPNPSTTANKRMLIATTGFGSLVGGVSPDYALTYSPGGGPFFNPNADTIKIEFVGADAALTFAGTLLPKNGLNALRDQTPNGTPSLISEANTPTNFRSQAGSVNLPNFAADFNGDFAVDGDDLADWKLGFGAIDAAATKAAGNADQDADVDGNDFLIWQRQVGSAAAVATTTPVPEPANLLLQFAAAAVFARISRALVSRRAHG